MPNEPKEKTDTQQVRSMKQCMNKMRISATR